MNQGRRRFLVASALAPLAGACSGQYPLTRVGGIRRQLLAGHFQALDYLHTAREDASRRMAPRLGVSPGEVRMALQDIRFMDVTGKRGWLVDPRFLPVSS